MNYNRANYSQVELDFIKSNYMRLSDKIFSALFGRSETSLREKRNEMGLIKNGLKEPRPIVPRLTAKGTELTIELEAINHFIKITESPRLKDIAITRRDFLEEALQANKY